MTAIEIKTEIQKVIDEVPETLLIDALNYLKHLKSQSESNIRNDVHVQKILREDHKLLKKLAQ